MARRTTPYLLSDLPPDDEGKKVYLMLYAVIMSCIKNRPLRFIMDTPSRDGRESLRKLDAEHRPTYRGRQLALLRRIMHPKLNSAAVRVAAGGARVRADIWLRAGSDREDCNFDGGSAAADAGTSSVTLRRIWHRLPESDTGDRGHLRSKKTWNTGPS